TEQRARVHKGERGHAIERHAFDHVGEEGRVAAARVAGDFDVGTGLTAGRFRPDARRDLEQIGRAFRVLLLDEVIVDRDDAVAGVQLLDARGTRSYHDLLQ